MTEASLLNPGALALLMAITFAASFAKGITTMGLNLLAVPLIAAAFDVQTAVVSLLLPKVMSDAFMAWESKGEYGSNIVKDVGSFALSGAVAIAAATVLLKRIPNRVLLGIVGVGVIAYVVLQMLPRAPAIPEHRRSTWGILFGSITGISQGLTGVGGPTTAMFLYSMALGTTAFVFLSSVIYLALDFCQLSAFLYFGLYDQERLLISVALAVPVMLGTWSGVKMRRKLSVRWFRYLLLGMLLVTALALLAKAV